MACYHGKRLMMRSPSTSKIDRKLIDCEGGTKTENKGLVVNRESAQEDT
jgi:hypothetical protein